jgi:molybdate transport repressor ModE-like protein
VPTDAPQLQHLLTLATIAREGSFSAAADSLGYTQSAVSQQIRRLEHAVGHILVERPGGPRRVRLTPAGELLLGHAEAIQARLASARADLAALADGTAGVLRVGCYQSVGVRVLPRVLGAFRARWPLVRVELTDAGRACHREPAGPAGTGRAGDLPLQRQRDDPRAGGWRLRAWGWR